MRHFNSIFSKTNIQKVTIYGSVITLTGTSGTANITINNIVNTVAASFLSTLTVTANNWVAANLAYYKQNGYAVSAVAGVITVTPESDWDTVNRINASIVNLTGDLAGILTGVFQLDFTKAKIWDVTFTMDTLIVNPINAFDGSKCDFLLQGTGSYNLNWGISWATDDKISLIDIITITINVRYNKISNTFIAISNFDPDAYRLFSRMITAGDPPTASERQNLDITIKALKVAGLYETKFDALIATRQVGTIRSKINLINNWEYGDTPLVWIEKTVGRTVPYLDQAFYQVRELSNGDLLAGCGASDGHYYRSFNKGETWEDQGSLYVNATGEPFGADYSTCVYDFCDLGGGIVLGVGSVHPHMFRSTDYGMTWTMISTYDIGDTGMFGLHYLPLLANMGNGHVVCTSEKSPEPLVATMLYSDDYGVTWHEVSTGNDITVINMLCHVEGGIIVAGGGKDMGAGVFEVGGAHIIRSTDYGHTWSEAVIDSIGVEDRFFGSVYLGNGVILAGSSLNGILFKSTDYGVNWVNKGQIVSGYKVIAGICNFGNGKALAGLSLNPAFGVVYATDDYGETWTARGGVENGQNIANIIRLADKSGIIIPCATNGITPAKIFKCIQDPFEITYVQKHNAIKAGAGVLTFGSKIGVHSDGSSSYLNLDLKPSTTKRFKLNNCSGGIKKTGAWGASGFETMLGCQNASGLGLFVLGRNNGTNQPIAYCNEAISGVHTHEWEDGYNCLARNNAAGYKIYINDDSYDITAASGVVCDKDIFALAHDEYPNPMYFCEDTMWLELIWVGAYMTQAEFLTFQTIMNAFFTRQ